MVVAPSSIRVYDEQWQRVVDRHAAPGDSFDIDQIHGLLAEDAARSERPHLDLTRALRAEVRDGAELYYPSEQHWNRAGNAVVARAIAEWLQQDDLLGLTDAP